VEDQPKTVPVEPPRGFFAAHVDEKGRLKLPVNMQTHMNGFGDDQLFVTSTDGRIAQIYTISVWKGNEKVLDDLRTQDPDAADALMFIANHYGAEGKIDPQGRVTLPTDLRRALALESQEVRLSCSPGIISVYSSAEYEARMRQHNSGLGDSVKAAKLKGFK
jgi:DNA-binding transcriptional regulator/RsmH inhibitor MraZ